MWWHIKSKDIYLCIPVNVAILYSVQNIVCVCMCVCYELSMSINMVQCSLHKLKNRPTDLSRDVTTFLIKSVFKQPQPQPEPNLKDFIQTSSWIRLGFCHVVLIYFCIIRWIIPDLNWNLSSDTLAHTVVYVIGGPKGWHLTRPPDRFHSVDNCWTNQRKTRTDSCSTLRFLYYWPVWLLLLTVPLFLLWKPDSWVWYHGANVTVDHYCITWWQKEFIFKRSIIKRFASYNATYSGMMNRGIQSYFKIKLQKRRIERKKLYKLSLNII